MSEATEPAAPDRRALAWAVRGALLLIGLGPLLSPFAAGIPGVATGAGILDAWYGFQCHRDPSRTLFLCGRALPVCVRCLGIYQGLGLGGLFAGPRLGAVALRLWVAVAATAMIADVVAEGFGLHPEWPFVRWATGALLAYPVSVALVHAARYG